MRAYHRWFGAVAALFLLFIAVTGIALQLDLWLTGHAPPGSDEPRRPPHTKLPADATLARMIAVTADAARTRHRDLSVERIELVLAPRAVATVGTAFPFGPHVRIDPLTGADIPEPPMKPGYHEFLQDIHAGYRFGIVGRVISVLCGLALLILSITGLMVYLDMLRRRRRGNRRGLFWR